MLIALAFAHFSSELLLKEQMIIPVKKTLNNAGHIDAKLIDFSEICQKHPAKSAVFYWLFLGEVSPKNFPWNRPIFLRICPENPSKFDFFPLKSREVGRFFCEFWLFSRENPAKSADFWATFDFFPAKIPRNRLIFPRICPWKSREILLFFPRSPVEMCRKVISHVHFIWRTINPVRKSSYKGHLRLTVFWNKNNEKCWHSYKSLLPGFLDIWNTTCSLTLYFLLDQEMLGCSEWLNKCFLYRHYLFLFFIQNISPIVIG